MSRLGHAAVKYAERGWAVFPLAPRAKHPLGSLVPRGFLEASTDPAVVAAWWAREPEANIGLVPGRSGFLVVDVDGPDGEAHAVTLGCYAEPTMAVTTGRADGGRHLYFRHPGGEVPNLKLAPKLDVRADGGYVVAPPSIHPSGAVYRWEGRVDDLRDVPHDVVRALTAPPASAPGGMAARDLPTTQIIAGGRNHALTAYAARLLSRAMPLDEIVALVQALNATNCKPPLPRDEVDALVRSMARTHTRRTGEPVVASLPAPATVERPTASALADAQTKGALALLDRDMSNAVAWAWSDLAQMAGPMVPGDLVVIGALSGAGKTTLMRNQADAWESARVPVLYLPLEIDAEVCRVQWAAQRCGFPIQHVVRNEWHRLPEGAREELAGVVDELGRSAYLHFVPDRRVSVASLLTWVTWGIEQFGARVVVIDHFHRMEFGGASDAYRIAVTEAARQLKDMGRTKGVTIVATAQLNRVADPMDVFTPPVPARIKESAGLFEEADVNLMLSRVLKATVQKQQIADLKLGRIEEHDIADPSVMRVTCRKHRLDATVWNKSVKLTVRDGRIFGLSKRETTPHWYEREAEA